MLRKINAEKIKRECTLYKCLKKMNRRIIEKRNN